jgi:DNA-binding transcriptional ArsR family regulator
MPPSASPPLPDAALPLVAARFRALGDPARLRILSRLMAGERSVGQLMEETGLSQTNLSRHLGVLRREGLVERRPEGNRALYRILDPSMVRVCELVCGSLAERLAGDLAGFSRRRGAR